MRPLKRGVGQHTMRKEGITCDLEEASGGACQASMREIEYVVEEESLG